MNWEMRHHYLLEATPPPGMVNELHSRKVIYTDSEALWIPMLDNYDRGGQLWENYVYWLASRDRPVPDAKIASSPFKRAFAADSTSTDTQSGHTSMCYLASPNVPEKECWYISMRAVSNTDITRESPAKRAPWLPPRWASGVSDGLTIGAPIFRPFIPVHVCAE